MENEYRQLVFDIIEEVINEVGDTEAGKKAIEKVFNRKADQIRDNNMSRNSNLNVANNIEKRKGDYHKAFPERTTQDRYDHVTRLKNEARKKEAEGYKLHGQAKRLVNWHNKNINNGHVTPEASKAANKMAQNAIKADADRMNRPS